MGLRPHRVGRDVRGARWIIHTISPARPREAQDGRRSVRASPLGGSHARASMILIPLGLEGAPPQIRQGSGMGDSRGLGMPPRSDIAGLVLTTGLGSQSTRDEGIPHLCLPGRGHQRLSYCASHGSHGRSGEGVGRRPVADICPREEVDDPRSSSRERRKADSAQPV